MTSPQEPIDDDAMTLDPPGSIAVIGAGPLGTEAALYGRFLGYEVTLIEQVAIGDSMDSVRDAPLPMLPGRCLSPLALSALRAQQGEGFQEVLPMTFGQWIDLGLRAVAETDLLKGRLRMPSRVVRIDAVPIEAEDNSQDVGEVPPDFRLTLDEGQSSSSIEVESVIVATGASHEISLGFELPAPYFFRIGATSSANAEQDLLRGFHEIVDVFAELAGRAELDLYRPRRG